MGAIECPYCGSEECRWADRAALYRCEDCGEWFEDDVPDIEHVEKAQRTKLQRDE